MADIDPDTISKIAETTGTAGGALAAVVAFLFKRQVNRLDSHDESLAELTDRIAAVDSETAKKIADISKIGATKNDIARVIASIERSSRAQNGRIDKIYEMLASNGRGRGSENN